MICDWYEYELLSPMHAGMRKPYGHFMECADHVPGSVVRGACAEAILRHCPGRSPENGNPDCPRDDDQCPAWDDASKACLFSEVFLGEAALLFTSAYAIPRGALCSRPAPLTLRQCTRSPGSPEDYQRRLSVLDAQDDVQFTAPPHGLWDTLISGYALECRECAALMKGQLPEEEEAARAAIAHGERCPMCTHKAERVAGYLAHVKGDSGTSYWMPHTPSKERRIHVALNRSRRSAEEGLLFSRETVHRGTVFRGQVIGDERHPELLKVARRALAPRLREPLVFGRGGRAGLGHVRATWVARPAGESLPDRLRAFNDAAQTAIPQPKKAYFAIDALAPLLVAPVPETDWGTVLGIAGVTVLRRVQTLTTVSGWSLRPDDGSFGKRETSVAVGAGSVFLCLFDGEIDDLAPRLAPLEETGVGSERMRGYGRIEFSSPVHLLAPVQTEQMETTA